MVHHKEIDTLKELNIDQEIDQKIEVSPFESNNKKLILFVKMLSILKTIKEA